MNSFVNNWLTLLLPSKGRIWLVIILFHMIVTSVIGVMLPGLTEDFYTNFKGEALTPFIYLGSFFLAEYINRLGYQISIYKYVQHLLAETRLKTFGLWMKAPLKVKRKGIEDDFPLGEVLARVMTDSESVKELVTSGAFAILIDFIFIISCLIGFLRLDATVGGGLFVMEVIACILLIWGSRKMGVIFTLVRQSTGMLSRVVADVTKGLRELAFTPHKNYASKRGEAIFDDFLQKQLKSNIWDASYYSAAESLYPILLAMVLIVFPQGEAARMAILAVLIDLIQKSISPIKEVAGKISSIQRARTGFDRIREFHHFFQDQGLSYDVNLVELEKFHLKLNHFSYPHKESDKSFSLNDIDLVGAPGELIGLIGTSGCGKSTLLRLTSGQHGIFDGQVFLNNRELKGNDSGDLNYLSQHVSLVSQDSHVFSASAEFNITMDLGLEDFSQFWANAQSSLPYLKRWGIEPQTQIDVKALSLGQKQLLSGLRACYLRKPIVLFDEVSSGLDPDLEKALRDLVILVQKHSLTIIVTHRIETILSATKLLVMKEGRVVDQGTPKELQVSSSDFNEFLDHLKN